MPYGCNEQFKWVIIWIYPSQLSLLGIQMRKGKFQFSYQRLSCYLNKHRLMSSPFQPPSFKSPILRGDNIIIDSLIAEDPSEIVDIIHDSEAKKFRLGVILIIVAIVTWMIGLELVNLVLKDDTYQKPILFAYITGSCFSLNLVPEIVLIFKRRPIYEPKFEYEPTQLSRREVLVLSFQISIIYLLYNIATLSSLKYTSASNQTVLSSTTSIFTLFIGSHLKIDSFSIRKVICTCVSFIGVVLVNFSQSKNSHNEENHNNLIPKNPRLGNSLAICGALMYAFYLIIMKVKCGTGEKTTNERRLFGYMGVFTMIIGIPILYLADYFKIETFEFPPPTNAILILILVNGVFSYISDFVTILALLLTSPLITSLCLTSSVPITIFIDFFVLYLSGGSKSQSPVSTRLMYFTGISSILVSVVLINLNSSTENELIEEVIEETLEQSIRNDEVLSPVLSPLLTARPHSSSNFGSPLIPFKKDNHKHVTNLSLEGESLINRNHSNLYTVETNNDEDLNKSSNLLVYGGNNHIYHVKHVSNSES